MDSIFFIHPVVVMDNCPTHHNLGGEMLKEFLVDMNVELVKLICPHIRQTLIRQNLSFAN